MKGNTIKCDCCNRFISYSELDNDGGASKVFIPDTEFTYEESRFRCKKCTIKKGMISSEQSAVIVQNYGAYIC